MAAGVTNAALQTENADDISNRTDYLDGNLMSRKLREISGQKSIQQSSENGRVFLLGSVCLARIRPCGRERMYISDLDGLLQD